MSLSTSEDYWDFYSCEIDGKPHSTMVNLSLQNVAPIDSLSVFHCVEIELHFPSPDHGMTTNEEFQPLSNLEDLIGSNQTNELKYIARQTGDGKRKFYFYGSSAAALGPLIKSISQSFPSYEKTTFNFEDAGWRTYFEDLYPNAIAMNEITNRVVCYRLEENGDDLSIPRTIDHSIILYSKKQVKEFEQIAEEKGFTVEVNSSGFFNKSFDLLVQREDAPSSLDPITLELEQIAESLGGSYDGWGCYPQSQLEDHQ